MNYNNKIAIVTGGTGALGRVIVNRFAREGMKVYLPVRSMKHFMNIFDRSQQENAEFGVLLKRYAIECDATDEDQVREFCENVMKQEKRINYLINTIGGYHPKTTIEDMSTALITSQLQLNFYPAYYFTKYALTLMKQNNFGRVVSIGAKPAVEITSGKFAYAFSKLGVVNLMHTLALELKDSNFTFNTIIPNIIDTPANRESMPKADFSKWVKPEVIAEKCLELVSDEEKKVNGEVIKMY
ncbi:MAG TPA: SDR family NAD(P)-dependent oxidoreductase [Ignavibacteria bacterium]|jgi:NAD(P)-dependent dehydrogenase (short-subunit alcohol dehydrogenase family)